MKLLTLIKRRSANRSRQGMTLLELMVSMALLTVIILGLYSMFEQTQKALLRGGEEVDVQETARSAFRVMLSQVDEVAAAGVFYATNFNVSPAQPYQGFSTNFLVRQNTNRLDPANPDYLIQGLVGTDPVTGLVPNERRHELQDFFFLTREGRDWKCTGYFVRATAEPKDLLVPRPGDSALWQQGVGSLYRFELKTNYLRMNDLFLQTNVANFFVNPTTGSTVDDPSASRVFSTVHRVADGIVHLRVITHTNGAMVPLIGGVNNLTPADNVPSHSVTLTNQQTPSHIEIELGVLEPKTLGLARSIPAGVGASNLLYRSAGNVLMFRARVPVRTRNDSGFQ